MRYCPESVSLRALTFMAVILLTSSCSTASGGAKAKPISVTLSQEQDGGQAGRVCIYVHQGKAEYRRVAASEACAPEIEITSSQK